MSVRTLVFGGRMCEFKYWCIFLIQLSLLGSVHVSSPCPGTFDYIYNGNHAHGQITYKLTQPATTVTTSVNFTLAARIPPGNYGRMELLGDELSVLQNANRGGTIQYRVHFPAAPTLPRLTELRVNGEVFCYGAGDYAGPGQYVTTIGLHHILYLKSGTIDVDSSYFNNKRPDHGFTTNNRGPGVEDFNNNNNNNEGGSWNDFNSNTNDGSTSLQFFEIPQDNSNFNTVTNLKPNHGFNQNRPQNNYDVYMPEHTPPPWTSGPQTQPPWTPPPRTQRPWTQPPQTQPPWTPRPQTQPPWTPPPQTQAPWTPPPQTQPPYQPPASAPTASKQPIECGTVYGSSVTVPLVHKGNTFTRGDWPWLTAIYAKKDGNLNYKCAGTLISDRHVLTAAHCVYLKNRRTLTKDIVVKLGVHDLDDWGDDVVKTKTVIDVSLHQYYEQETLKHDISLLTIDRKVVFNNYIRPVCLWEGNNDLNRIVGAIGVVTGWGSTEDGPGGHGEPRMVRMPIRSTQECRGSKPDFHRVTSNYTLCAGDRNGAGPCTGDSGGGLYLHDQGRWRIRGIVSFSLASDPGSRTCNLKEFVVFTDSAQYVPWIQSIIKT